jgi:hypothetical protein
MNSPKMELFDAVACLESSLTEFSHMLDQSGQAIVHRRFIPLILDDRGEQETISPWCWGVHVYQNPPLLGSLPATLEGSRNIFVAAVMT